MVLDGMTIAALILGIGRATEATKLGESIRKVLCSPRRLNSRSAPQFLPVKRIGVCFIMRKIKHQGKEE